jgi:predicted amidohydrolase YtcJ
MDRLLVKDVEVDGARCDVFIRDGRVASLGSFGAGRGARVVMGNGGALLPGLHDHHAHILALAAARKSISLSGVQGEDELMAVLRDAGSSSSRGRWLRCVGYDAAVMGPLDRWSLDKAVGPHPIRVQHRSGSMWVFNSAALQRVRVDDAPFGVERDDAGTPTGRLYGLDAWLRTRVPGVEVDLSRLVGELAGYGVTGVTDMTPFEHVGELEPLAELMRHRAPLRIVVTGSVDLGPGLEDVLPRGPVKLVLPDHGLPSFSVVVQILRRAHAGGRSVAVHSVTLESLLLALAAWAEAGAVGGDRIEHAAIAPPQQARVMRRLGLTVVTQPNFVRERGDSYLAHVDPLDIPWLYPCRSLIECGVAVGFGTDAPFGHPDPWLAIAAAVARRTAAGAELGVNERISAAGALARFLTSASAPGGPPRRLRVGAPADLCLLRSPLGEALKAPSSEQVELTVVGGCVVERSG